MEHKTLLSFLKKAIAGFSKADIFALRETANNAIEEAALASDKQLAKLAMMAYCLHKISSKEHIVRHGRWKEIKHDILFDLRKAEKSIAAKDFEDFDKNLNAAIDSIRTTDEKIGNYAQNVFEKAKVKYASTAYSMGLGLGQAAALEKKELLRYIGITRIADRDRPTVGIGERLRRFKRKIGEE